MGNEEHTQGEQSAKGKGPTASQLFFLPKERGRTEPTAGLEPGAVIGDFRLLELIGQGGMGQVWKAEQRSLGKRIVAVKFVRPECVNGRQLELFAREARAAARLQHPGLVTVHAYGHTDGLAWIAMEFIDGAWTLRDSLDEVMASREVPAQYDQGVARLVAEIAEAMHSAHEAGIIHRDLKPQNILISQKDQPKVTDFGLARIVDEAALSVTGDFAGTYFYMSPEQVTARRMGLDHRTDIFSLGIVLYEMLALQRPFVGDTSHQVAAQIVTKDPPDPRLSRSRVPRDLAVIAGKALEKDRDRRYPTMLALAADLRRYLANEPIEARPPTALERMSKWCRRHPTRSTAAALLFLGFLVVSWLLFRNVRANEALVRKTVEADRAAAAERERSVEVFRLSAMQDLDDLITEATDLWPAIPENIGRFEAWLARAARLRDELPAYERSLETLRARALPWSAEQAEEQRRSHPKTALLAARTLRLAYLRDYYARLATTPPPERSASELGIDESALPADSRELLALARALVDPDRSEMGKEERGLALARLAFARAPEASRAGARACLAAALQATGRIDEAARESAQAQQEASPAERDEVVVLLARVDRLIANARAPDSRSRAARNLLAAEEEIAALEREISARPWTFQQESERWWHAQLEKLVERLHAFCDPQLGLLSAGVSPEHGWGVERRLTFARKLRDEWREGELGRQWSAALPAIRARYPSIDLEPQNDLLPLGPDPRSGLWEFAHLASGTPARRGGDGRLLLEDSTGLVLVLLPGGTFRMGVQRSSPEAPRYDPASEPNEGPVHEVTLSPFFLSKYEMSQGQWVVLTGKNPSLYDAPFLRDGTQFTLTNPVESVSRRASLEVCRRVGLTLPTEAQWEYGARAGTETVWWTGNDRESLRGAANLADQALARAGSTAPDIRDWPELDDGFGLHAPIDALAPNPFGLHHVHGNVWEWCLDGYLSTFYQTSPRRDPLCETGADLYLGRGGSFGKAARGARSSARHNATNDFSDAYLGLRPARPVAP